MSQYKALIHAIRYVIDTEDYFYQINSYRNITVPWELHGYIDADYAGDNDTRKCVTVYIVQINGAVIDCIF